MHNPDFVALSRAFGADGAVVDGTTDVDAVLQQAMAQRTTPFVIDLRCNPRIPPPLSTWESALFGRQGIVRTAVRDGEDVRLTPTEYALLTTLATQADRVLTRG